MGHQSPSFLSQNNLFQSNLKLEKHFIQEARCCSIRRPLQLLVLYLLMLKVPQTQLCRAMLLCAFMQASLPLTTLKSILLGQAGEPNSTLKHLSRLRKHLLRMPVLELKFLCAPVILCIKLSSQESLCQRVSRGPSFSPCLKEISVPLECILPSFSFLLLPVLLSAERSEQSWLVTLKWKEE